MNLTQSIASFTFDDFPRSALLAGGPLLQRYGGRGTYYAALGMMGTRYGAGDLFTRDDLQRLVADGHELGCHTFSHLPARRTDMAVFESDLVKNRREMEALLPGYPLQNFAYPGGEVTLRLKRRMRRNSGSCRGTYNGINRGVADLDLLLCQDLFESVPLKQVRAQLEDCRARPGWIIFYGHDVSENPSVYGCSPGYLEEVLKLVKEVCPILTVSAALAHIRGQSA